MRLVKNESKRRDKQFNCNCSTEQLKELMKLEKKGLSVGHFKNRSEVILHAFKKTFGGK